MDSDYNIIKCLYVYWNNTDYFRIELYRDKKYFHYDFNVDDKEYETIKNEYNKNILISNFKPIILYNNHSFVNISYLNKYINIINIYLIQNHKTWENITKIVLAEEISMTIDNS